jgi:hypothetical protein
LRYTEPRFGVRDGFPLSILGLKLAAAARAEIRRLGDERVVNAAGGFNGSD